MEADVLIFWIVCFSSLAGLGVTLTKVRIVGYGWVVVFLLVLALSLAGWLREQKGLIYAGAAMWLLLIILPGLLSRLYYRRLLEQHYSKARGIARIIGWLHPADGWPQQP